jgi:hypothetical protein
MAPTLKGKRTSKPNQWHVRSAFCGAWRSSFSTFTE